jgi:hypothetical protein
MSNKFKKIIWLKGTTVNDTNCTKKLVWINGTAWTRGYYEETIFTAELSAKDFELYNMLEVPNWYLDYTGKALTIQLDKYYKDFGVTKTIVDTLKLKDIKWTETSYET